MKVGLAARVQYLLTEAEFAEPSTEQVALLHKGPRILIATGLADLTRRAILATDGTDAILVATNAMLAFKAVVWSGPRSRLSHTDGLFYLQLTIDGREVPYFCPPGAFRKRFKSIATPN